MGEPQPGLLETFKGIAGADRVVDEKEFIAALRVDARLGKRAFEIFDRDHSGRIDIDEFVGAVESLTKGTDLKRMQFAFDLHDLNGDGRIDEAEVSLFLVDALRRCDLAFEESQVRALVRGFIEGADQDRDGRIDFSEFCALIEQHPALAGSMQLAPVDWLKPPPDRPTAAAGHRPPSRLARLGESLSDDWRVTAIVAVWIAANAVAFLWGAHIYAERGASLAIVLARGSGMALNLNGALILFPVMRRIIRALRDTRAAALIPLDSAAKFHRMVGTAMLGYAIAHVAGHFANYAATDTLATGPLGTVAGITGVALFAVFMAMWVTAQDEVRKSGRFRLFFLVHLLFVGWFALMLLHGPSFWQWGLASIVGFGVDRLLLRDRSRLKSRVVSARFLPGSVIELHIERPLGFRFQPGDYVLVKCLAISAFEWHPFTISSPPEESAEMTLHVRAEGAWTGELHRTLEAGFREAAAGKLSIEAAQLPILIDGPYGTPSSEVFVSQVAVLVAGGIGATPFSSIIESIHRRRLSGSGPVPERVYFHWVSRGQRSFEWLVRRLRQMESEGPPGRLEVQVHLTGVDETQVRASTLYIAMDLLHRKSEVDLITGLRTKTNWGRPDWKRILGEVQVSNPGKRVDVFFCGPPALGEGLKQESRRLGFTFRTEVF